MQSNHSEARAHAISYILLVIVLILVSYAVWSHWSIESLMAEEASQLGVVVRGAPALLASIAMPLLLLAIHFASSGQLLSVIRQHWVIFSIAVIGICTILGSVLWLLRGAYQWGAQDSVLAAILMVPVTVLFIGFAGYAVAARFDGKAGSR